MPTHVPAFVRAVQAIGLSSALALLSLAAHSQSRLDKTGWRLDPNLSEEFDPGTTLATLAPRWHLQLKDGVIANPTNKQPFEPYVTRDNVYIANGCAYLNTYKYTAPIYHANDRDYHYAAPYLQSRFDDFPTVSPPNDTSRGGVLYGMFEIRCKLPTGSGQYPSFWLSGDNAWPPEIDVFEFNGNFPNTFFSTVHWENDAYTPDGSVPRDKSHGKTFKYARRRYLTKKFHTWTLVWTPTRLAWFLDAREIFSDTVRAHIPGAPLPTDNPTEVCRYRKMDIILNSILNYPDSAATAFEPLVIDYVHVYRPASFVPYQPSQPLPDYLASLRALYQQAPYEARGRRRRLPVP